LGFCKHLFVCDLGFGIKFLQEIQAHYDNNLEPKMFTKNSNSHVLFCEQGAKSFSVEAMECVWNFDGSQ